MAVATSDQTVEPPAWRVWLARITVALMPLSINIEHIVLERFFGPQKRPTYFSPFDVLLPALLLLLAYDLIRERERVRFKFPPVPVLLWLGLAAISCLWINDFPREGTFAEWARGIANPLLVVVLPVWVFANLPADFAEYRRLTLILGASFSVCVFYALVQYFGPIGLPFDPSNPNQDLGGVSNIRLGGWYDFRALFGAQAAMLVPVAMAFRLLDTRVVVRIVAGAMAFAALIVTLAAGGFVAACAGSLAVIAACWLRPGAGYAPLRMNALLTLAALLVFFGLIVPRLPRDNASVLLRGLSLYADAKDNNGKDVKKPTARLRRYQAAVDLLGAPSDPYKKSRPNWVLGVGTSQYQERVNQFFQPPYDKPSAPTDMEAQFDMDTPERYTFGLLETVGVELGVGGVIILMFFFATWVFGALGAFNLSLSGDSGSREQSVVALAAFGAGCGAMVLSIFANPALRGSGPGGTFAFFFALAVVCGRGNSR